MNNNLKLIIFLIFASLLTLFLFLVTKIYSSRVNTQQEQASIEEIQFFDAVETEVVDVPVNWAFLAFSYLSEKKLNSDELTMILYYYYESEKHTFKLATKIPFEYNGEIEDLDSIYRKLEINKPYSINLHFIDPSTMVAEDSLMDSFCSYDILDSDICREVIIGFGSNKYSKEDINKMFLSSTASFTLNNNDTSILSMDSIEIIEARD